MSCVRACARDARAPTKRRRSVDDFGVGGQTCVPGGANVTVFGVEFDCADTRYHVQQDFKNRIRRLLVTLQARALWRKRKSPLFRVHARARAPAARHTHSRPSS